MRSQNSSISNFKRFLRAIFLPVVITVGIAGTLFSFFFEKIIILSNPISGEYKINRILNKTYPNEIPIFGSSRAEFVFIPDSLGGNYFNYGLAGTGYDVSLFFLEHECDKVKSTPWVILNFDLEGLTYGLGDISNYILNSRDTAVRKLLGTEYRSYFSIPFIKYYGRYENYLRLFLSNKMQLTKLTNKGAEIEKDVLSSQKFDELVEVRKRCETTFRNDPSLQQKLLSLIVTHPNRYFLFVIPPYHSSYFVKYTNNDAVDAFLHTLSVYKNVKVLNYSKMALPDSMFLNTTHINLKGAIVFNHVLRDTLTAMGVH